MLTLHQILESCNKGFGERYEDFLVENGIESVGDIQALFEGDILKQCLDIVDNQIDREKIINGFTNHFTVR